MEPVLYLIARFLIACIRVLPLRWVARLGRCGGALAYWLDARHRRVALRNLTMCFGREKSAEEIRAIAQENFRRIGENFACAARTSFMDIEQLRAVMHVEGLQRLYASQREDHPNIVAAIGHFGNFELYARFAQFQKGFQSVTTYRSLREPSLNRLLQSMRERSGCLYFERRTQGVALKAVMNRTGIPPRPPGRSTRRRPRVANSLLRTRLLDLDSAGCFRVALPVRALHRRLLPRGPRPVAVRSRRANPHQ